MFRWMIPFAALFVASISSAQSPSPDPGDPAVIADIDRIRAAYQATRFETIKPTPIRGIYEAVLASKRLLYITGDGRFFIVKGHIVDMETQKDLTEPVLASLDRVDVSSFPLTDAIKIVKGNGRRTLYVFSDPECPYCKLLERDTLAQLTDITVYTFVFPIAQLHPAARDKAISVWCSQDRGAAWNAVMGGRSIAAPSQCDHPIDRNVALAKQLGFNATPTLVSADGRKVAGALTADKLLAFLDQQPALAQVQK